MINKILNKYVNENGVQWVNLPAQKHYIKNKIMKKLINMAKDAVNSIRKH